MLHEKGVGPARLHSAASGREILPDPLAGVGSQAAQLPVAANAVDVVVLKKRCRHDAVQLFCVFFAGALALPRQRGRWFIRVEIHHHRPVVKRGDEQPITKLARGGDRQPGTHPERFRPVNLAGVRIERVE